MSLFKYARLLVKVRKKELKRAKKCFTRMSINKSRLRVTRIKNMQIRIKFREIIQLK